MAVEKNLRTCGDGHMFICFMIFQENTTLRKPYEDYFKLYLRKILQSQNLLK